MAKRRSFWDWYMFFLIAVIMISLLNFKELGWLYSILIVVLASAVLVIKRRVRK